MNRPTQASRGVVSPIRERLLAVTRQSERTVMLGTVLVASTVSAATGYLLAQCFSVDVLSSLVALPEDCWGDWGTNIGRHCFSDYGMVVGAASRANPWERYPLLPPNPGALIPYPAAGMMPHLLFGLPARWLGAPMLGLLAYLLALTIAVLSPAVWAARGACGLERAVVFVALGAAAIPAWFVIDRGNSAGFAVPIALVFLVALRRRRWRLVAIMVILAAVVKPQFALLAVVLFAARQWRLGGLALGGIVVSNLAAFLLWPRDFPATIGQWIHNLLHADSSFSMLTDLRNVSFGHSLLLVPDTVKLYQAGGKIPDGFLAGPRSLIGYAILVAVLLSVLAMGRRIPPVMVGILLLATATLFPPMVISYYLVFVLPVAALVVRDPDGPAGAGLFDRLATQASRRRAVGMCVSVATALSIAQIAVPGPISHPDINGQPTSHGVVGTTVFLTGLLWLIACAVIIASYLRRPDRSRGEGQLLAREGHPDGAATYLSTSEPVMESPTQRPI
ncbi:glycosyltransferase family 87 protein [Mycobacterium seoulense]|uniref:Membrane protein n=1 Tax=Mycobacterium seoulense TaxID=386911 RepID=A0A7I7NV12_9MYCO|nr:glycosyltransferase family 87 protein [Mycobacterium seoulense]MCV7440517.1 DUF2029 domain-containing protein [Mycobacterium seoulense]BBY00463.1 membrane protein [Mycobacterium seoulense]